MMPGGSRRIIAWFWHSRGLISCCDRAGAVETKRLSGSGAKGLAGLRGAQVKTKLSGGDPAGYRVEVSYAALAELAKTNIQLTPEQAVDIMGRFTKRLGRPRRS